MLVLKRVSFCEPIYSIHILGVYQHHGRSGNYQEYLRVEIAMIEAKFVQLASPAKTDAQAGSSHMAALGRTTCSHGPRSRL